MRRSTSAIKQMMCHVKDDINLQINLFNSHSCQMGTRCGPLHDYLWL